MDIYNISTILLLQTMLQWISLTTYNCYVCVPACVCVCVCVIAFFSVEKMSESGMCGSKGNIFMFGQGMANVLYKIHDILLITFVYYDENIPGNWVTRKDSFLILLFFYPFRSGQRLANYGLYWVKWGLQLVFARCGLQPVFIWPMS